MYQEAISFEIVRQKLTAPLGAKQPRAAMRGRLKGKVWMARDFDAPIEEMQDYM